MNSSRNIIHESPASNDLRSSVPENTNPGVNWLAERLNAARNHMDNHFLSIRHIRDVAMLCSISEFHFFRSFRQAFHITPYQYLLKRRLQLAHDMLMTSDHSITEIADCCNFPDLYTFSKAFKREYGVPPSRAHDVDR